MNIRVFKFKHVLKIFIEKTLAICIFLVYKLYLTRRKKMKNIYKLIISLAIPLLVGYLGSLFTSTSVNSWYLTLKKPSFNPPNWIFAPVWTSLFILIGLSFYLIWRKGYSKERRAAFFIYFIQLSFNLLWSFFFFGLKSPFLGLLDIVVLLIFILINIYLFYKISKASAYLLLPYLLWVSFASILNFYIFVLN